MDIHERLKAQQFDIDALSDPEQAACESHLRRFTPTSRFSTAIERETIITAKRISFRLGGWAALRDLA